MAFIVMAGIVMAYRYSLLSAHYSLIYGGELGFHTLGVSQVHACV